MTEQEIIRYLKENRKKGVIYDFMPSDVRCWCSEHRDESIFYFYTTGYGWHYRCSIDCNGTSVYCLPDDYEPEQEQEFKPHWEEFDINENGYFYYEGKEYYYRDDVAFEKRYSDTFKGFGGWLFNDKIWCTNPQLTTHTDIEDGSVIEYASKDEKCKPVMPTKIRFWRYKE